MSSQLGDAQLGDLQLGGVAAAAPTSITLDGIASAEVVGAITLSYDQTFSPSGIASAEAVGAIALVYDQELDLTGIASAEAVGSISLPPAQSIVLAGVASGEAVGAIALGSGIELLEGVPSGESVGPITLFTTPQSPVGTLFVDGVEMAWIVSTLRLRRTNAARSAASFRTFHNANNPRFNWRPEERQEVEFWDNTLTKRFGGFIQKVSESSVDASGTSFYDVECTDYQSYTDRVVVARLFSVEAGGSGGATGGGLIAIIFREIWREHLTQFGVTYVFEQDPGLVLGPTLFHYITATECFNQLVDRSTGFNWWIDQNKVLHLRSGNSGTAAAPFNLSDTEPQKNWDRMSVRVDMTRYRNRQWVLPSSDVAGVYEDVFIGDGTPSQTFVTLYALNVTPVVYVTTNGSPAVTTRQIVTAEGEWIAGYQWYYIPGSRILFQNFADTPLPSGYTLTVQSPAPFPLAFSEEDEAEIAAHGLYENVFHAKDVTTQEEAETVAAALLELYKTPAETVTWEYNSHQQPLWLDPGMTITSNTAAPVTSGTYYIESVESQEQEDSVWRHRVTARNGVAAVDEQYALQQLRVAQRSTSDLVYEKVTMEIATDIPGITNPGLEVGPISNRYVFQGKAPVGTRLGVLYSWDILAQTDPPVGADIIIDVFINDVSIFGTDDAEKMVLPDGTDTLVTGYNFRESNIVVYIGDVLRAEVLQVGSTDPGKNITAHVTLRI